MSQRDLLEQADIEQAAFTASLSEATGLTDDTPETDEGEPVSLTPRH